MSDKNKKPGRGRRQTIVMPSLRHELKAGQTVDLGGALMRFFRDELAERFLAGGKSRRSSS